MPDGSQLSQVGSWLRWCPSHAGLDTDDRHFAVCLVDPVTACISNVLWLLLLLLFVVLWHVCLELCDVSTARCRCMNACMNVPACVFYRLVGALALQ